MGITFKANVSDIRSPALEIINALSKTSLKIMPYDPFVDQSEFLNIYQLKK